MIVYPAEWKAGQEAVFAALALAGGGGRRLPMIPLSFRDFPQTEARTDAAVACAKHRPKSALVRCLKRLMIRGQYNWSRRYFTKHPNHIAIAWNGLGGSRMAFLQGAKDAGAPRLYAELAPLSGRISLDPAGVNARNSVPRQAQFYRDWASADPVRSNDAWRTTCDALTARPSRRADVRQSMAPLPDTPFLFCPLQVPHDTQVQLFAGWTGGMEGFLAALSAAADHLPDGWHLRLKEHPSARKSLHPMIAPLLAKGRIRLDNASDSFAQVAASHGVVTLNSSMGLQSFFHDKPVVTLGQAFFAIPGLVMSADNQDALNAAFAAPEALTFDPMLRNAFMNWLDQVYFPRFSFTNGQHPKADLGAFADKLAQARAHARV